MVVNQFKIERLRADGSTVDKGLKFHSAYVTSDSIQVNNVSLPIAGQDTTKNFSRNFGGFQRLVTVNFILNDDGSDKSTDGASIITLSQQRDYLQATDGVIQGVASGENQIDVKYKLTIYENAATKTITGTIEDINIGVSGSETNLLRGSLNLFESGQ